MVLKTPVPRAKSDMSFEQEVVFNPLDLDREGQTQQRQNLKVINELCSSREILVNLGSNCSSQPRKGSKNHNAFAPLNIPRGSFRPLNSQLAHGAKAVKDLLNLNEMRKQSKERQQFHLIGRLPTAALSELK
mmetsp:Transcript_11511/g.19469  ORF Transcript_11511/g.19469 Transcript_11511/m.19469 type:complete len:132 (-) Transcript_11511:3-398(-)